MGPLGVERLGQHRLLGQLALDDVEEVPHHRAAQSGQLVAGLTYLGDLLSRLCVIELDHDVPLPAFADWPFSALCAHVTAFKKFSESTLPPRTRRPESH